MARPTELQLRNASDITINPATEDSQKDGSQKTQVVDQLGNVQPAGDVVSRGIFVNTYQANGVPIEYTKIAETSLLHSVTPGTLSKLRARPQIINEHAESSREVMGVINATTTLGQIFRPSQDNINGIILTLESAAAETVIDDIEYGGNDLNLQAAWVLTGTNLAVTEATIISSKKGSTESMALMMDKLDVWTFTKAAGSWNMTGGTIEFDYYQTKESVKATMTLSISDGVNSSVITLSVPKVLKNIWQHFSIPVGAFVGTANTAATTNLFYTVTLKNGGELAYVDNLRFRPQPGSIDLELWDHGTTVPTSGSTVYTNGTQYTELGDRGIGGVVAASINLSLKGGKQLYHISEFTAGVAPEISTNTLLNINNYYSLVLKYVDTDVSVYGPDTTLNTNYYTSGYGWSAPVATGVMTVLPGANGAGAYSDLMFGIFSTQDVYLKKMEIQLFDNNNQAVNSDILTEASWFIEDDNMGMEVIAHETFIMSEHSEDFSERPMYMPKGGKAEVYYSASVDDPVVLTVFEIVYFYIPPITNG